MQLNVFLGSAEGITKVKIYDGWQEDKNNVLYEGSYGEFSHKIFDLELDRTIVIRWSFEDGVLLVGVSKD